MILDDIFKGSEVSYQEHKFKGKSYFTGVGTFTPQVCKRLQSLTKNNNFNNRKVSPTSRKTLVDEMVSDNWQLTGQTIVIDNNGSVIDGGHRISAVAASNVKGFDSFFTFGVDTSAFKYIDVGRGRTGAQILEIEQGDKVKGVSVNNMIKADRLLSNLQTANESTGTASEFYKLNKSGKQGTAAEMCEAVMKRFGLQSSFLVVKDLLKAENKVRKHGSVDTLKLSSVTLISLVTLYYLHTVHSPSSKGAVKGFIAKVLSYKNPEKYYTRFREDTLEDLFIGNSRCNKQAVSFLYIRNLYTKVETNSPKNLTVSKLAGTSTKL